MRTRTAATVLSFVLALSLTAVADQISEIIGQVTMTEYQSYMRILTGVDPVPGNPPFTLTNRYSAATGGAVANRWIKNQFTDWGYTVSEQSLPQLLARNVIAEKRGVTHPESIYIFCGHYDSIAEPNPYNAPGANDNASSTAGILAAARLLATREFDATVRFIGFAGEEQGLVGSFAYAQRCRQLGENIAGVINMDMLLHPAFDNLPTNPDYDLDISAEPASMPLANYLVAQFERYTSIDVQVHDDPYYLAGSDHLPFWIYGYPAIGLSENTAMEIWGGSYNAYHSAADRMDHDNFDWEFGLDAVRGGMAGLMGLAGLVPEPQTVALLFAVALLGRPRVHRRGRN